MDYLLLVTSSCIEFVRLRGARVKMFRVKAHKFTPQNPWETSHAWDSSHEMETSKSIKSLPATFRWIDDKKLCGSFGLAGLVSWSVVNRAPKIWKWVKANVALTACKSGDGSDGVCWWKSVSFQSVVENQLLLYILCCCRYQLHFTLSFLISGFETFKQSFLVQWWTSSFLKIRLFKESSDMRESCHWKSSKAKHLIDCTTESPEISAPENSPERFRRSAAHSLPEGPKNGETMCRV